MLLQEVKQFLKDNAGTDDVKSYMAELSKVSVDQESQIVENYKRSQDFKSEIDRAVTKGINTYTEKSVPSLIEKEVKAKEQELENKYNPPKNPAEEALRKKVEELSKAYEDSNKKVISKEVENAIHKLLGTQNISADYADLITVDTSNLTMKDIEDKARLEEMLTPRIQKLTAFGEAIKTAKANEMLSNSATKPVNSNSATTSGQLTQEQYSALPIADRIKAQKDGRVKQILGQQ